MEKTSPGLCLSKETSVRTFIVISDYDVANNSNNNNVICIEPYGRDFRGAGCMADRFSWV